MVRLCAVQRRLRRQLRRRPVAALGLTPKQITWQAGVWLENARNANERAARLEAGLRTVPAVEFLVQRQANAVFAKLPPALATGLRSRG